MPHITADRVYETTTTTGTGALTLAGAVSSAFVTFASRCTVGDTCFYQADAVDATGALTGAWEVGLGTYSAANTLTRTTVLASSNAGAAVNFAAGTKRVSITLVGARTLQQDNQLAMPLLAASAEPTTPAAGRLLLYAREIVPGHTPLKIMRSSGVDTPVQDDLSFNFVAKFYGAGTAMTALGAAPLTASAAGTAITPASGTARNATRRMQFATTGTAGNVHTLISPSDSNSPVLRGNVNGEGGFRVVYRFSLSGLQAGNRGFWGIAATRTAGTNVDPLTVAAPARIGLGFNANTGNWFLIRSDGTTAANADLGANFPLNTNDMIELVLFCRPHNGTSAGDIGWRVRRYTTNSNDPANEATGTLTTNLPGATALLHPWVFITNNATAAVCSWQFSSLAVQSDL